MTFQVTRLESGGMVQIRTGVLQGIGPQGPTGATGPQGETGPAGPQGIPGPTGGVDEFSTSVTAATQALALTSVTSNYPSAWTNVSFGTVVRDELSAVASAVNYKLPAGADYFIQARIRFYKQASVDATGFRGIQAVYNGVVIAETLVSPPGKVDAIIGLTCNIRSTSFSDILNIKVCHSDTATLNITGALWLNRTGPGAQGAQGDQGIQGPIGPQGVQGPIGPAGAIVNNTTTIGDIGGTNPA